MNGMNIEFLTFQPICKCKASRMSSFFFIQKDENYVLTSLFQLSEHFAKTINQCTTRGIVICSGGLFECIIVSSNNNIFGTRHCRRNYCVQIEPFKKCSIL